MPMVPVTGRLEAEGSQSETDPRQNYQTLPEKKKKLKQKKG
jgi:hypothetical protein